MSDLVFFLSALTSCCCALLLWRGYRATMFNLLFWSSLGFVGLTVENILLVCDRVMFPSIDLENLRNSVALLSWTLLLVGLVWESEH
jgi:hypothetical protein